MSSTLTSCYLYFFRTDFGPRIHFPSSSHTRRNQPLHIYVLLPPSSAQCPFITLSSQKKNTTPSCLLLSTRSSLRSPTYVDADTFGDHPHYSTSQASLRHRKAITGLPPPFRLAQSCFFRSAILRWSGRQNPVRHTEENP